jgi:hypothetical protein
MRTWIVHCCASSHGHVTSSCKHVGIVLRFKNKWSYATPPTPSWSGQQQIYRFYLPKNSDFSIKYKARSVNPYPANVENRVS